MIDLAKKRRRRSARNIGCNVFGINSRRGPFPTRRGRCRRQRSPGCRPYRPPGSLDERDCEGVRLFARRAAGHPHADGNLWIVVSNHGPDRLCAQRLPRFRIAKEVRDADQQILEQRSHLVRMVGADSSTYSFISTMWFRPMRRRMRRSSVPMLVGAEVVPRTGAQQIREWCQIPSVLVLGEPSPDRPRDRRPDVERTA